MLQPVCSCSAPCRAAEAARAQEAKARKLNEVLEYEEEEMKVLQEFFNQVRIIGACGSEHSRICLFSHWHTLELVFQYPDSMCFALQRC